MTYFNHVKATVLHPEKGECVVVGVIAGDDAALLHIFERVARRKLSEMSDGYDWSTFKMGSFE